MSKKSKAKGKANPLHGHPLYPLTKLMRDLIGDYHSTLIASISVASIVLDAIQTGRLKTDGVTFSAPKWTKTMKDAPALIKRLTKDIDPDAVTMEQLFELLMIILLDMQIRDKAAELRYRDFFDALEASVDE